MSSDTYIFKRIEKKYLLTETQKAAVLEKISGRMRADEHGKSTVMSLYLDTPDFLIIRNSIDAKTYKEKLRLRSYGTPDGEDKVFLELKKKYKGVVYKRRVSMSLNDAYAYIDGERSVHDTQIMHEINAAMSFYSNPRPAALIAYEREAFFSDTDAGFRITFDSGIRYRFDNVRLEKGSAGKPVLPEGMLIMEIKTAGAMPLWMSEVLDELQIYPTSFSKYGTAYKTKHTEEKELKYA